MAEKPYLLILEVYGEKVLHPLSQCVVEIKRRSSIKKTIVDEVAAKIARMKRAPNVSVRAALVYDGNLAESILSDGYFDAIIPFRRLLGV